MELNLYQLWMDRCYGLNSEMSLVGFYFGQQFSIYYPILKASGGVNRRWGLSGRSRRLGERPLTVMLDARLWF